MIKKNYALTNVGPLNSMKGKLFLKDTLGLTGCEVSMGNLPKNECIPFVHAHKMNEELYVILSGNGVFFVDGEEFEVKEGSFIRVSPSGNRSLKAKEDLAYLCIQMTANSLRQSTKDDGIIMETKTSWM